MSVADMEPDSEYQIVYGSDRSCGEEITKKMTELLGYGPTGEYQIGAAVAANAGPKVVGVILTQNRPEWHTGSGRKPFILFPVIRRKTKSAGSEEKGCHGEPGRWNIWRK